MSEYGVFWELFVLPRFEYLKTKVVFEQLWKQFWYEVNTKETQYIENDKIRRPALLYFLKSLLIRMSTGTLRISCSYKIGMKHIVVYYSKISREMVIVSYVDSEENPISLEYCGNIDPRNKIIKNKLPGTIGGNEITKPFFKCSIPVPKDDLPSTHLSLMLNYYVKLDKGMFSRAIDYLMAISTYKTGIGFLFPVIEKQNSDVLKIISWKGPTFIHDLLVLRGHQSVKSLPLNIEFYELMQHFILEMEGLLIENEV